MSDYRLQIVHSSDGRVVTWRPGHEIETDLIDALCARLKARGVGIFTSEARVLSSVKEEFGGLLFDLKRKVR